MSNVQIYSKKKDKTKFNELSDRIRKVAKRNYCSGDISQDFIDETINNCDYLFVHMFKNVIRGFAYVSYHNSPKHLYIDLICNSKFHSMTRKSTKNTIKFSGKNIIDEIIKYGKKLKVKYVKLSAIESVILYYYKLNFTFKDANKIDEELLADLRKAQIDNNDTVLKNKLNKIVGKYYRGFYSEKNQSMLGSNKKQEAMDDGIPMIYHYKKESICKGKSIKNPNKCTKHKQCKIAVGTKRSYCRNKNNKTRKNNL